MKKISEGGDWCQECEGTCINLWNHTNNVTIPKKEGKTKLIKLVYVVACVLVLALILVFIVSIAKLHPILSYGGWTIYNSEEGAFEDTIAMDYPYYAVNSWADNHYYLIQSERDLDHPEKWVKFTPREIDSMRTSR